MPGKMIDINNVHFRYKGSDEDSLAYVNLQIAEGEFVVLCGESGCGKSTVTRLINGLIPFYHKGQMESRVTVFGQPVGEGSIYDLGSRVSTVFQNPRSQLFCVDVRSELGLEKLLDRTMFQLSGGEKQKITCASVAVTDNPIIVLDEPSSNLDMCGIAELKAVMRHWKRKGKTVIIAEHRLEYLKEMADRFVYMKKGRIVCEFNPKTIQKLSSGELMNMGLRSLSYDGLEMQNRKEASGYMRIHHFAFQYKGAKDSGLSIDKLDIPKASVIAVIGRNGAGKSTFAKCFCGLEKRARGLLENGKGSLKAKKRLERSFLVMQDVNRQLFAESVEEEITLGMEEENRDLSEKILKEFDLYDDRGQRPMSLSGGQKQRVAVAGAMASRRDFIFLTNLPAAWIISI